MQNWGQQVEVIGMKISTQYKEDLLDSRAAQALSRLIKWYDSPIAGIQVETE